METLNCETVRMAASAAADGQREMFDPAQLEDHLVRCNDCRSEIERLDRLMRLLDSQRRQASTDQLWSRIETRLPEQPRLGSRASRDLRVLAPTSIVLISYKLLEQLPLQNIGFQVKLLPLLLVIALFALVKENPFRINPDLQLKGDLRK